MKQPLAAFLFVGAMLAGQTAFADDEIADVTDMQALRTAVRTDKKAFVASTLKLTDAEAKKFWPAYDTYQRHLDVTNRERNLAVEAMIGTDKPVSDLYARNLSRSMMAVDDAEVKARRALSKAVLKALPAKKATRYLQLEAKIRAVGAYDVAATIPLVK